MKEPIFFASPEEFRSWLDENHETETEIFVGFYKKKTGKAGIIWSDAVDQALCYGWIDSVLRPIDDEKHAIRFTPRKPKSIWSNVNIKKVEDLMSKGLMKPAGIEAFSKRTEERSGIYAFENPAKSLSPEFELKFKENPQAWEFFQKQAPYYKKLMIHRVMSAKQLKTRQSRLEQLIRESASGRRIS